MKRFMLLLTIALASFSLLAANAEAKRMGSGSSVGKQRSISPQQTQKAPAAAAAPAAAGAAAPAAGNKWLVPDCKVPQISAAGHAICRTRRTLFSA